MEEEDIRRLKRLQLKLIEEKPQVTENEKPYNVILERVMLDGSKHPITKIYRENGFTNNQFIKKEKIVKTKDLYQEVGQKMKIKTKLHFSINSTQHQIYQFTQILNIK